ncbi:MAG: hypothetical protein P4M01_14410 [Acidobacteriota bacterium]|nr:hypothetical protein [Acidobacteriota bacterium]
MAYLTADEYKQYGLEDTTPDSLVSAASDLIDAHCRRNGFGIGQYMERFRVGRSGVVRLTYLPLASVDGVSPAIVLVRGRYRRDGRNWSAENELAAEVAAAFVTPSTWVALSATALDVDAASGEVIVLGGLLTPALGDLEITYTAGYAAVPEAVKQACAQLTRNAMATPALNVRMRRIDRMTMQYFSETLIDADVQRLLAPYVAQRMAS